MLRRDIEPPQLRLERWRWVAQVLDVAVILAALATVPLIVAHLRGRSSDVIVLIDWLIWTIFFAEYVVMLCFVADRRGYVRGAWLSLLIVVITLPLLPALLDIARLARLVLVMRLLGLSTRGVGRAAAHPCASWPELRAAAHGVHDRHGRRHPLATGA